VQVSERSSAPTNVFKHAVPQQIEQLRRRRLVAPPRQHHARDGGGERVVLHPGHPLAPLQQPPRAGGLVQLPPLGPKHIRLHRRLLRGADHARRGARLGRSAERRRRRRRHAAVDGARGSGVHGGCHVSGDAAQRQKGVVRGGRRHDGRPAWRRRAVLGGGGSARLPLQLGLLPGGLGVELALPRQQRLLVLGQLQQRGILHPPQLRLQSGPAQTGNP
jgi:hypothetical protein